MLLDEGIELFKEQKNEEALTCFLQCTETPVSLYYIGYCYIVKGNLSLAKTYLLKSYQLDKNMFTSFYLYLWITFLDGRFGDGLVTENYYNSFQKSHSMLLDGGVYHLMNMMSTLFINPDVQIFGDSVYHATSETDKEKRTLAQMIDDNTGSSSSVGFCRGSSFHTGIFYLLTKIMELFDKFPRIAVIPINLRVFSPQWDLTAEYKHLDFVNLLNQYITKNDEKLELLGIDNASSDDDFMNTPVQYYLGKYRKIKDFSMIHNKLTDHNMTQDDLIQRKKELFIYYYGYILKPQNRKLRLLLNTIKLLKQHGVRVLTYITPINVQAAKSFAGTQFTDNLERNLTMISDMLEYEGLFPAVQYYDFSCLFNEQYFAKLNETTEHLGELGRESLGNIVSGLILGLERTCIKKV